MGTTATAVDTPHDHERVLGDVFEIDENGLLFDMSHDSLLGALTVKDCMLSHIDMEGAEHTAAVSGFVKDDDGNTFPQMLRWNNGEGWTCTRPELENHDFDIPEALCSEVVEEVDCSMVSVAISGKPLDERGNLQDLLAHIQNRDREIQEALSSVEEVDCSKVSAAILGKPFDEYGNLLGVIPFDADGNLQGVIQL